MPTCNHCGDEFLADELVRHEVDRLSVVHCPSCDGLMGSYRRHGQRS